jgi:hypothetical protein
MSGELRPWWADRPVRAAANEGVLPPAVRRLFHGPGVAVWSNEFIANRRDLDRMLPGHAVFALEGHAVFALEPEPLDPVLDGPRGWHVFESTHHKPTGVYRPGCADRESGDEA